MRVIPLYEPNLLVHQRTNGMVSVKKNHTIQEKKRFQDLVTRDFQSDVDIFQNFHFTVDVDDIKRMKSQWVSGTMIYMYLHFLKEETNRRERQGDGVTTFNGLTRTTKMVQRTKICLNGFTKSYLRTKIWRTTIALNRQIFPW